MTWTRKSKGWDQRGPLGEHSFQHWYRDNQVYFITARCREKYPAFAADEAKAVFWSKFEQYTLQHNFTPWVISLLDNHYHVVGYLKRGDDLGEMMRKLHGSVAKLVNDLLPERRVPFWRERGAKNYFDGCLRDGLQLMRSYRYTLTQAVRHGMCAHGRDYPHTRVGLSLDESIAFARAHKALLHGVPYRRYERVRGGPGGIGT